MGYSSELTCTVTDSVAVAAAVTTARLPSISNGAGSLFRRISRVVHALVTHRLYFDGIPCGGILFGLVTTRDLEKVRHGPA
jgi:hypothetical protein